MKLKSSNVFRLKKVQNQTRLKWKLCLFAGSHRNPSPTLFVTLTTELLYPVGFDSYSIAAEEKARELEIQARYKSDISWNILSVDLCCLWRQLPKRFRLIFQKSFFGREIQEQAEQTSKDKRVYYIVFLVERHFCTSPVQSLQKVGSVQTFGKFTLPSSGYSNSIALSNMLKLLMC